MCQLYLRRETSINSFHSLYEEQENKSDTLDTAFLITSFVARAKSRLGKFIEILTFYLPCEAKLSWRKNAWQICVSFCETEQDQLNLRSCVYPLCKIDYVYPTCYFIFIQVSTFLCSYISIITSNMVFLLYFLYIILYFYINKNIFLISFCTWIF